LVLYGYTKKFQEEFKKNQTRKISEILNTSTSVSKKIKNRKSKNSNQKIGDEVTKSKFASKEWYGGQCQICGYTFRTNQGENHFERFTWTDFGRGSWTDEQKQMPEHNIIDESNSLCLCSRCHSILKHGGQFSASFLTYKFKKSNDYTYDDFIKDMEIDKPLKHPECFKEHVEWEDMYFLEIKLNNNEEYIYFTEEHLIAFFTFLKS
jgi:5-methylcytosine-specific restriction endonuclease McrA